MVVAGELPVNVLSGILIGSGALLAGYCILATAVMGPVSFNAVLLGAGVLLISLGVLDRRFGQLAGVLRFKKIAVPAALLLLAVFAFLEGLVISGAARKDRQKADYIVVLGAGLREDQLSLTLLRRMEAALECEQGETFVVTGGQGWNEKIPEGVAMGRWLEEQGIPPERILVEDRSVNTHENLLFSRQLIEEDAGRDIGELRIKIVTSDFHSFRAQMLARRHGYQKVSGYGGKTPPLLVPAFYIREGLALAKSFLLDR